MKKSLSPLLLLSLLVGTAACVGLTARDGAQMMVDTSTATATGDNSDCHFTLYQTKVAPIVQSQCINCHGTAGNGSLLLSTGSDTTALTANYNDFLPYIEASSASVDNTSLISRISAGGNMTHPLKLAVDSDALASFSDFAQTVLSNTACTTTSSDPSASPTPDNSGGFF